LQKPQFATLFWHKSSWSHNHMVLNDISGRHWVCYAGYRLMQHDSIQSGSKWFSKQKLISSETPLNLYHHFTCLEEYCRMCLWNHFIIHSLNLSLVVLEGNVLRLFFILTFIGCCVVLCIVTVLFCVLLLYCSVCCYCVVLCVVTVLFCVLLLCCSMCCYCVVLCVATVLFCVLLLCCSMCCYCVVLCVVTVLFCLLLLCCSMCCYCVVLCVVTVLFYV
jgi:hypothetical protein